VRPAPARFPIVRRPPLRLVVAALVAVLCGLVVLRATDRAEAAAARYGSVAGAWVATTALRPGEVVGAGDVAREVRPVGFVPAGAVTGDPVGRRVTAEVAAGEVVVEGRLAGGDRRGAAALVPEGWRAVAVPAVDAALPVEVGQRVDVVAATDAGDGGAVGAVVADDGVVVHVGDDGTVTVAVTRSAAPRIVAALSGGYVALALVG